MTSERNESRSVALSFLVVLAAVSGGVVAATGGVAAEHGSPGNYTVHLPDQADHNPDGDADVSVWHLAAMTNGFEDTPSPKGFETADFLTIGSDEIDFSNCGTSNTAAFGLDRGNDDPGTKTDQDLLRHRKDSQFNPNGIVVEFFDEEDFGETVNIDAKDQIVAAQNDCYKMPSEPGWYQIFGTLNGTGYNGNKFEIDLTSHYFYICDCSSEQEAREKLGPPPSEQSGSESTPTPEPEQSTPTPTAEPEQSTPTPTAEPEQSTPTPTPAQAESTPTASSSGDDPTATAASQQSGGQQQQSSGQQQQQQQATATAAGEASVPVTPTVAEGPGFGAGLALVALAGAALLALRRSP